jgi:hypothetical protein
MNITVLYSSFVPPYQIYVSSMRNSSCVTSVYIIFACLIVNFFRIQKDLSDQCETIIRRTNVFLINSSIFFVVFLFEAIIIIQKQLLFERQQEKTSHIVLLNNP